MHRLHLVETGHRAASHEQLVEHDGQREHVGPPVDLPPALDLFRGHVGELPLEAVPDRVLCAVVGLGHAEVDELHLAPHRQHDVPRVHVAVHDVHAAPIGVHPMVGVVEGGQHVGADAEDDGQREGLVLLGEPALEASQVTARHVLHGQEELVALLAEVVDARDVLVLQFGVDARFVVEHPDEAVVGLVLGVDALDHQEAHEARVVDRASGEVDLRHAAFSQAVEQDVGPEGPRVAGRGHGPEDTSPGSVPRPGRWLRQSRRVR